MPRALFCSWGRNWVRADTLHFRPLLQIQHSGNQKGTGLGLAFAQEIAKHHDATISVSSGEDGTVFEIRFAESLKLTSRARMTP